MSRRVWLDDYRKAPFGWEWAKTYNECVAMLLERNVHYISLDHDLAEEHYDQVIFDQADLDGSYSDETRSSFREKTGYDVCIFMCQSDIWPARINIHSMNPAGRMDMYRFIRNNAPSHIDLMMGMPGQHPPP